jgi:drug/metabolite transporter (DMT)-like permease
LAHLAPANERPPGPGTLAAWGGAILLGGAIGPAIRLTLLELAPFWSGAVRLLAAGMLIVALIVALRPAIGSRGSVIGAVVYGIVGFTLVPALTYWGLLETPAVTAQLLTALVPLLALAMAVATGLERFRWRAVAGSFVCLVGVLVVFVDQIRADIPVASLVAILFATLATAAVPVIVKLTPGSSELVLNGIGMLVGAGLLVILSIATGERWITPTQPNTWAALAFLVLGGSVATYWLWIYAVRRWTASSAAFAYLLLPLVTIVYAAILLGESVSPTFVVGGSIVTAGVWIGALSRQP